MGSDPYRGGNSPIVWCLILRSRLYEKQMLIEIVWNSYYIIFSPLSKWRLKSKWLRKYVHPILTVYYSYYFDPVLGYVYLALGFLFINKLTADTENHELRKPVLLDLKYKYPKVVGRFTIFLRIPETSSGGRTPKLYPLTVYYGQYTSQTPRTIHLPPFHHRIFSIVRPWCGATQKEIRFVQ